MFYRGTPAFSATNNLRLDSRDSILVEKVTMKAKTILDLGIVKQYGELHMLNFVFNTRNGTQNSTGYNKREQVKTTTTIL